MPCNFSVSREASSSMQKAVWVREIMCHTCSCSVALSILPFRFCSFVSSNSARSSRTGCLDAIGRWMIKGRNRWHDIHESVTDHRVYGLGMHPMFQNPAALSNRDPLPFAVRCTVWVRELRLPCQQSFRQQWQVVASEVSLTGAFV